jgi:hypothetical protein
MIRLHESHAQKEQIKTQMSPPISLYKFPPINTDNQDASAFNSVSRKRPWSAMEDSQLCELVDQYGPKRWSLIAYLFGSRSGRQCRERWFNHLDPSVRKGPWTTEEDKIIAEIVKQEGHKWSLISKHLPGRTDNAVKNRFNSTIKKRMGSFVFNNESKSGAKAANDDDDEDDDDEDEEDGTTPVDIPQAKRQRVSETSSAPKPVTSSSSSSSSSSISTPKVTVKDLLDPVFGLSLPSNNESSDLPDIMKSFS